MKRERSAKERLSRERDQAHADKYAVEQSLSVSNIINMVWDELERERSTSASRGSVTKRTQISTHSSRASLSNIVSMALDELECEQMSRSAASERASELCFCKRKNKKKQNIAPYRT